jgi:Zn-dependent peptidase ImmA (M78 family)
MLSWARKERGYSIEEAAKKIRVTPEKLKACELGTERLTFAKFRKAAWVYRRPTAIFFLRETPPSMTIPNFRRMSRKQDEPLSPALRLEIRKVYQKRKAAIELAEFAVGYDWGFIYSLNLKQDPEESALQIREMLSVPQDFPKGYDKYGALNFWRQAIEKTGTLVFMVTGVELDEMRGFAIAEEPFPSIVANRKDSPQARCFTLIHEFSHILLGDSSLCEIHRKYDYGRDWSESYETYCNHVAGATLVPKNKLLSSDIVRSHGSDEYWSEGDLRTIASRFRVSAEVVLRRLLTLKKTTSEFYGSKHQEWSKRSYPEKKGFPIERIHEKVIRTDGLTFTRMVLDALHENAISPSQVSELFFMNLKHLPALETLVNEQGK